LCLDRVNGGWVDPHALVVAKLRDPVRHSWIGASVKHLSLVSPAAGCAERLIRRAP
jgi:hypothetical protein